MNSNKQVDFLSHLDSVQTTSPRDVDFCSKYVDIKNEDFLKLQRNEMCPCGSGKKLKHCHIEEHHEAIKKWRLKAVPTSARVIEKRKKRFLKLEKRDKIREKNKATIKG